jgi:hypothetical protein
MQISKKKLIPVAVLLASLTVAIAWGFVYPWVYTATSKTTEPFTITIYDDLSITYPGQTDEVILKIANAAPVTYGVKITVSLSGSATWTYDQITGTLIDKGAPTWLNIAQGDGYFWIKVTANPDAAVGDILVAFQVERVAAYP